MALVFKNQVLQKPGRVKIAPENGAEIYASIEGADEPIEVGPPTRAGMVASIHPVDFDTSVKDGVKDI